MSRHGYTASAANGEDLDGATVDVVLVDSSYTFDPSHAHLSDITGEVTASGYARQTSTVTVSTDGTDHRVARFDSSPSFNTGAVTDLGGWVVAKHTGTDSTARLVAFIDDVTVTPPNPYVITAPSGFASWGPSGDVQSVAGLTGTIGSAALAAALGVPASEGWHQVGAMGEPAFSDSWASYGPGFFTEPRFRKVGDVVFFDGVIVGGTPDPFLGSVAWTFPAGYRPSDAIAFVFGGNQTVVGVGGGLLLNTGQLCITSCLGLDPGAAGGTNPVTTLATPLILLNGAFRAEA